MRASVKPYKHLLGIWFDVGCFFGVRLLAAAAVAGCRRIMGLIRRAIGHAVYEETRVGQRARIEVGYRRHVQGNKSRQLRTVPVGGRHHPVRPVRGNDPRPRCRGVVRAIRAERTLHHHVARARAHIEHALQGNAAILRQRHNVCADRG